jgi:hypothetical protein
MIIAAPIASEARAAISHPLRRKRCRQRRQAKQRAADHQQSFKADAVTQGAHRQHHSRHHQRVNIDDPQQFIAAGASVMLNVGAATCSTVASIATGIYTSTIITNANH